MLYFFWIPSLPHRPLGAPLILAVLRQTLPLRCGFLCTHFLCMGANFLPELFPALCSLFAVSCTFLFFTNELSFFWLANNTGRVYTGIWNRVTCLCNPWFGRWVRGFFFEVKFFLEVLMSFCIFSLHLIDWVQFTLRKKAGKIPKKRKWLTDPKRGKTNPQKRNKRISFSRSQ